MFSLHSFLLGLAFMLEASPPPSLLEPTKGSQHSLFDVAHEHFLGQRSHGHNKPLVLQVVNIQRKQYMYIRSMGSAVDVLLF